MATLKAQSIPPGSLAATTKWNQKVLLHLVDDQGILVPIGKGLGNGDASNIKEQHNVTKKRTTTTNGHKLILPASCNPSYVLTTGQAKNIILCGICSHAFASTDECNQHLSQVVFPCSLFH